MFQKHSIIHTESGSIKLLVVDVNHQFNKISFFDLNREPVQRKTRKSSDQKPSIRGLRIQRKPSSMELQDFSQMLNGYDYLVERAEYNNGLYVPERKPHLERQRIIEERTEAAECNFDLIRPIVEDPDKRYAYLYTDRAQQCIKEISLETGVSTAHISRLLSQYFYRGGCESAMFPNYRYCGCNYQPIEEGNGEILKRGRPSSRTNYRNRTQSDEKNIERHLRKLGKRKFKQYSYQAQYEIFDYHYQSEEVAVEDDNGVKSIRRVPRPQSGSISYNQYYHYVKRLEKDQSFAFKAKGEKFYLVEYTNRLNRARDGVGGPSFRYEVDATREDVYLAFPYFVEQRLSSGRPTTYRAVCSYSSMVVGIHVGIGGPNWQGVFQLLYNTFTDKVEFCRRFGVDIEYDDWPCDVVCTELTIDNGVEYPSKNMAQILEERFGIDCINYTAIYTGQAKGTVEGGFEIDKKEVIQFMPGYVERAPERGSRHASNFAMYTYEEFVRLLIVQTLIRNNEVYNNRNHDQVMSEQGVKATALEVWKFGMRQYMNNGRGKRFPKEQLLYGLLPSDSATTTDRGIRFKKLYYSCDHAAAKGWLTSSKSRPVKKLDVRYFDGSTEHIWYRHQGKIYTAKLNSHSEIYKNRSWFDALHRLELYEQEKTKQSEIERQRRFAQKDHTEEVKAEAKKRFLGSEALSTKAPVKKLETIAYMEKIKQNLAASSHLHTLLGGNKEESATLSDTQIRVNTQKHVQDKNFMSIYGEGE